MADYATWQDVQSRWRTLTADEQNTATTRIGEASALLRREVPDIDARIADDPDLGTLAKAVVSDAVVRAMSLTGVNPQGANSIQESAGPRSYSLGFSGGAERPSGVYFTDVDLQPLRPRISDVGTSYVGIRPGWAPSGVRRRSRWPGDDGHEQGPYFQRQPW